MILVHIKTRLDLLGIQTFRWDRRLGRQYSKLNRRVSTQEKQSQRQYSTRYLIMHGVIEIDIQSSNIRELYTVLFTKCFTLRVRFLIGG